MKSPAFLILLSISVLLNSSAAHAMKNRLKRPLSCMTVLAGAQASPERDLPIEWVSAAEGSLNAKVHLRLTTLANGLRFATMHKKDGTELFDSLAFRDGATFTGPEIKPFEFNLSDGFKLTHFGADHDSQTSSSQTGVEKKYSLPDHAQIRLSYDVDIDLQKNIKFLRMKYEYQKNRYFFSADIILRNGRHHGSTITVYYNLSGITEIPEADLMVVTDEPQGDMITFDFDPSGKLIEIRSLSQSTLPNPFWTAPEFTRAIRKVRAIGKTQDPLVRYEPETPEAHVIFKTIFGRDLETLDGMTQSSVDRLLKAAIEERDFELSELLSFNSRTTP